MSFERIKTLLDKEFNQLTEGEKAEIEESRRQFVLAAKELSAKHGWQFMPTLESTPTALSARLTVVPYTEQVITASDKIANA